MQVDVRMQLTAYRLTGQMLDTLVPMLQKEMEKMIRTTDSSQSTSLR